MIRPVAHSLLRQSFRAARPACNRRSASTAPPHLKSRSWRNFTVRCGIAVAGIYYYNTSTLFADEPALLEEQTPSEDESLPTLATLSPSSRFRPPTPEDKPTASITPSSSSPPSIDPKAPAPVSEADPQSPEELEEEASQQGAFNEETGEINWDCPCLGGMAHGPCGEEFRTAFSCFVFSKEDPKGMDCIENFKNMQGCFREHPDIYGAELDDDEDEEAQALGVGEEGAVTAASLPEDTPGIAAAQGTFAKEKAAASVPETVTPPATPTTGQQQKKSICDSEDEKELASSPERQGTEGGGKPIKNETPSSSVPSPDAKLTEDELVPKAAHDATSERK